MEITGFDTLGSQEGKSEVTGILDNMPKFDPETGQPLTQVEAEPVVEVAQAAEAVQDAAAQAQTEVEAEVVEVVEAEPMSEAAQTAQAAAEAFTEAAAATAATTQTLTGIPAQPDETRIITTHTDQSGIQVTLSPEEQMQVNQMAKAIDLSESKSVLTYGAASQQEIAQFSDAALQKVKTKDLGQVSDMITGLVAELHGFSMDQPEKKGLLGLFKKGETSLAKLKAEYTGVERNVDSIAESLQTYQNQLGKDIVMLDKMYQTNLDYYKELTLTILAGKQRLEEEKAGRLAELRAKAEESGLAEDAQAANDYASLLERFEKKIYDLELTRAICVQMAPQIRLVQNSDVLMEEKIQTTLTSTIPLWKNQMVLSLGMQHMQQAVQAQRQVTDVTNQLLKKNAEILQQGTIAVAEENERSIVDIETVEETNQRLIDTFNEVIRIQDEGRAKRAEAEQALVRIESELKDKLLEIRD